MTPPSYNPYAAPVAPAGGPDAPRPHGDPQPWAVGEVIRLGWETYKAHWAPLTLGYLVMTVLAVIPGEVAPGLEAAGVLEKDTTIYYAVSAPLSFVGWIVGEFFAIGFTRTALRAIRNESVTFGDFFSGGARFVPYVVMSFLRTLAIVVGFVLLIVPGIVLALGLMNAPFYLVDQNLGPIAALRQSWESSDGQKGDFFVFSLAEAGLVIAGVLACCLGLFLAVPVTFLAHAILYTRVSGTAAPPAPPASPGPYGGWGPPGSPPGAAGPPGYALPA